MHPTKSSDMEISITESSLFNDNQSHLIVASMKVLNKRIQS